ncbi:neutral/alkaline non-lysosomal ceramidase N-terminal domain-containing protein [Paenibacillus mendelii]|uniref:Neutral/alkaline non-lysosomal ceramidase N-terminal domain-containing protein n=1 Tax=Paenibacillus mendelii TaxID=206163 RepID=A0ABV6JD55_9BACL|nr:neutral/alkaline non-lysosomal ceramidase N-terminal domain-containing protein [Paenibacillus mendelii]MCQ6562397.1 neutral/alkaline non-lysosomal ceramidase N-terminal domain-containing protein [Paenibacillus mendelii]
MELQLSVGTAKVDITPPFALPLAGFASRNNRKFETINSRLYVRTFYFQQCPSDGSKLLSLLVSADILFWSEELADQLRMRIERQWGIAVDAIILHATHTHSGPAISMRTVGLGEPDPEYLAFLEQAVIQSVEQAIGDAEPVSIQMGKGVSEISVNRRKWDGNQIVLAPNVEGVTDPELRVYVFATSAGRRKGVLTHYACHPTLSDRNSVSSEFCGYAMEQLESRHDPLTVYAYLQGCCGDINPVRPEFVGANQDVISIVGQRFADDVEAILSGELEWLEPNVLTGRRSIAVLPFAEIPEQQGELRKQARFEITKLTIADGLTFIAMNGEMVVEYGLFLKSCSPGLVPLAYSNGMIGYITTAKQLQEGGYEPIESVTYFGLPCPFDQAVEAEVKRQLMAIIDEQT